MDISAVKTSVDQGSFAYGAQTTSNSTIAPSAPDIKLVNKSVAVIPAISDKVDKKSVAVEDLKKMTATMNQSLESMDTNIRFKYHEKTKELMVQVVDQTNNKVLREIPSHEFLDTIAAIRSCVGVLLDKKM